MKTQETLINVFCENMDAMVQFLLVSGNRDLSKRTLRLMLTFEEYALVEIADVNRSF